MKKTNSSHKCPCCDSLMEETLTNFTVVKDSIVYVVRKVPALECTHCGHISFQQDVSKQLERFASGRIIPMRPAITAWEYSYNDPIIEVPDVPIPKGTQNTFVASPVSSGYPFFLESS